MSTFNAIKSSFERSYDKQYITLVVISYEISYEMTSRVISFMYQALPLFFLIEATFVRSKILLGTYILSTKRRGYLEHKNSIKLTPIMKCKLFQHILEECASHSSNWNKKPLALRHGGRDPNFTKQIQFLQMHKLSYTKDGPLE